MIAKSLKLKCRNGLCDSRFDYHMRSDVMSLRIVFIWRLWVSEGGSENNI